MENNQLHININNGKVKLSYKNPMDIKELIQVLCTCTLIAMKGIVQQFKTDTEKEECTETLYDVYNAAASNTLAFFAPEIEMRPHLTSQAILDAENKIIDDLYKKRVSKDANTNSKKL